MPLVWAAGQEENRSSAKVFDALLAPDTLHSPGELGVDGEELNCGRIMPLTQSALVSCLCNQRSRQVPSAAFSFNLS